MDVFRLFEIVRVYFRCERTSSLERKTHSYVIIWICLGMKLTPKLSGLDDDRRKELIVYAERRPSITFRHRTEVSSKA